MILFKNIHELIKKDVFVLPLKYNQSLHSYVSLKIQIFKALLLENLFFKPGAYDNVNNFSMLSNPAGIQSVSCLGLSSKDICAKNICLLLTHS